MKSVVAKVLSEEGNQKERNKQDRRTGEERRVRGLASYIPVKCGAIFL
jgi:hypothetical protein